MQRLSLKCVNNYFYSQLMLLLYVVYFLYQVRSFYLSSKEKYTMRKKETKEPLCEDIAGKDCGLKRVIDTVGGKGQEKDVDEIGISLKDAISKSGLGKAGFTKARVVSSDEFAAEISFDEINEDGKAYLAKQQEDDGSTIARLYVFGDSDSKRQVKNVVRIELLNE